MSEVDIAPIWADDKTAVCEVFRAAISDVARAAICFVVSAAICAGDINVTIEVISHRSVKPAQIPSALGVAYLISLATRYLPSRRSLWSSALPEEIFRKSSSGSDEP
jgi:hypothetical protein